MGQVVLDSELRGILPLFVGLPESKNSAEPGVWSSISQKENIIAAQGYFL